MSGTSEINHFPRTENRNSHLVRDLFSLLVGAMDVCDGCEVIASGSWKDVGDQLIISIQIGTDNAHIWETLKERRCQVRIECDITD